MVMLLRWDNSCSEINYELGWAKRETLILGDFGSLTAVAKIKFSMVDGR